MDETQTSLIVSIAFGLLGGNACFFICSLFPCVVCHASGLFWELNAPVSYLKSQVSVGSDQVCVFCVVLEELEYSKMVSLKCWTTLAGLYCL